MRILCVTNLFPNSFQPGKGIFNWRQLSLMAQRAEVRVISPVLWTDELHGRRRGGAAFCDGTWREWEGVEVAWCRYYYTPRCLRRFYGSFFEFSIRKIFQQAVADFHPDLVYACWPYPDGWAAHRLARQFHLPVVVKVHGSDLFLLEEFPARIRGTADVLQSADAVLGVGQALCDAAVRLGARPERCHVVQEGVDRNLFCPGDRAAARRELGLPPDVRRLLFVGGLLPVKRVNHLIEACRLLKGEGGRLHADIIGDGPQRPNLERQVLAAGLADSVHLRGRMSSHQLPAWYRAADLFVLPSDSEGVPNVLMEAAACGTPFVATAVGCIPEIAGYVSSELVPPGDPDALARAIQRQLAHSERKSGQGGGAAAVPSVADGVVATLNVFAQVLASRPGASSSGSLPDLVHVS